MQVYPVFPTAIQGGEDSVHLPCAPLNIRPYPHITSTYSTCAGAIWCNGVRLHPGKNIAVSHFLEVGVSTDGRYLMLCARDCGNLLFSLKDIISDAPLCALSDTPDTATQAYRGRHIYHVGPNAYIAIQNAYTAVDDRKAIDDTSSDAGDADGMRHLVVHAWPRDGLVTYATLTVYIKSRNRHRKGGKRHRLPRVSITTDYTDPEKWVFNGMARADVRIIPVDEGGADLQVAALEGPIRVRTTTHGSAETSLGILRELPLPNHFYLILTREEHGLNMTLHLRIE